MKTEIKYFIIIILGLGAFRSFGQIREPENIIYLVANGSGNSKEQAHQNALKSAISQTISGLITTNPVTLIDHETMEKLLPLTSSFLNYSIAYDDQLPNGIIASTLKVRIDADNFSNLLKTVGINIAFKGGKIALQIKQQMINEKSEMESIARMIDLLDEPMHSIFDYKIKSSFPKSLDDKNKEWAIPVRVQVVANKNIDLCSKFLYHTLSELTIEMEESGLYEKMNKKTLPLKLNYLGNQFNFLLRKPSSLKKLDAFIAKWEYFLWNFNVTEGTTEYSGNLVRSARYRSTYVSQESKESILNPKQDYQFEINLNKEDDSDGLNLIFPKSLQFVGEFSWFDKKTLTELETIGNYSVASGGFKLESPVINEDEPNNVKSSQNEELDNNSNSNSDDEIFTAVEQQAEFPGGPGAWGRFMQKTLKYPSAAQRANVGGRVLVSFVVNTDGSVQDIQILKGVGFGCDEEAIRIIKSMPRWNPGRQSGRAVRSRFTQPITFVVSK